jgi:hypothetical protein
LPQSGVAIAWKFHTATARSSTRRAGSSSGTGPRGSRISSANSRIVSEIFLSGTKMTVLDVVARPDPFDFFFFIAPRHASHSSLPKTRATKFSPFRYLAPMSRRRDRSSAPRFKRSAAALAGPYAAQTSAPVTS